VSAALFDVAEVCIATRKVSIMRRGLTERNADAYIAMAVARRGVEESYFTSYPANTKNDGDDT
jgi:hypothetical protein